MINIKTDSRLVIPGDTFIAIKGCTVDGHDYIDEAIKNGASKVVAERGCYSIPTLIVEDTKEYLKKYLVEKYSNEFKDMKFVGITGTNGKTTTTFLTSQILTNLGVANAYIGTVGYYINSQKIVDLNNTTPDILTLYNLILNAKENGVKVVCMEVSSHSLEEERIAGVKLDVAAFTNLTQDHLDYHKTMENYLKSKLKILNYLKSSGVIVINNDDEYAKNFKRKKFTTIGVENASEYKVENIKTCDTQTKLVFSIDDRNYIVSTNLLGKFNVYNYITAVAIVNKLGVSIKDILRGTSFLSAPPGRNEVIDVYGAKAIIDYAHTPDAVIKILYATKETTTGKIYTIVGCGGERDRDKRPIMGYYATLESDYVIFTDDNPRREDEHFIMNQILSGVIDDNYEVIFDRSEAIRKGLSMLKLGDSLLILGKGHEDYQLIRGRKIHFSDKEEVLKYINEQDKRLKLE